METVSASQQLNVAKTAQIQEVNSNKKISFISAILLIISSCIGSGIFFKSQAVLTLNWGSFALAIFSWFISAIAVICMSIALIDVASKGKDNLSLIGWCRKFNSTFLFKCCKNFMFYVYTPLEFFYLPYYTVISLQNMLKGFGVPFTFNTPSDWAIWMVIGLMISTWFIFTSGINTKMADIQNKVILSIKFIPLVAIVILGFVIIGYNGVNIELAPIINNNNMDSFFKVWPGIGTILSLSAIFFAFDGFYFAAGIQKEMKEPKKTPRAIIIGLSIVTFIYLSIAIVMSLASKTGAFNGESGYENFLVSNNLGWLFGLLNLFIAFSVIGTLNGFTTWSTRLAENLIVENQLPFSDKFKNKIVKNKPIVGALYVYTMVVVVVLTLSSIGGLLYIPDNYLASDKVNSLYDAPGYYSAAKLFTFTDLMSNWASIFAFAFIISAICGCYKTKKINKEEKSENKYFKPTAIIAVIIVGTSLLITTIQPFADLAFINESSSTNFIISRVMLVVVLFIFLALTIIPVFFDKEWKNRKMTLNN